MKRFLVLLLILFSASVAAQDALIIEVPDGMGGFTFKGFVQTDTGTGPVIIPLKKIEVRRINPVPNPTKLAAQLIVLRDQTVATTKSNAAILDLGAKYQKSTPPELFVIEKSDTSKANQNFLKWKPATAKFPYLFIVGKDGLVLDHGELSDSTDANVARISKYQEKK